MLSTPHFGALLRGWRAARRMSQMDLATAADVSSRHFSCVETGKAQPGRDVVIRIAETLEIPLRDRNALLMAAGYAPIYPETALATSHLTEVRRAIDLLLAQQEPFPASVLDRHWNIVQSNKGFDRIVSHVLGGRPSRHANMIRQIFDPEDVRRTIVNWDEIAGAVIGNLQHALAATPGDEVGHALVAEVLAYPGVPTRWRQLDFATPPSPLLTTVMRDGEGELSFFSTITTFAMPRDVTLEELRIECCFPTDARTREVLEGLAQRAP
ncbi:MULTISPECIES: helix-turn-helix domain-containing protein [unclassified Caulobacter]|uniref:helix-turn-helix domain-containing protein n=1 Tax=unclassified Caulobacter TaxID=2648921 RepID=UPI000701CA32|nr:MULTISPECIES: helix-turn-helix transcriptional regulator [unclassified Caulobacter]KQV58805.1 XRE family transcriptional regulator [Caulobacter sp. Root342]KQV68686.1 XRE family transcriptional regulator [Caulobacter sp. Root343]